MSIDRNNDWRRDVTGLTITNEQIRDYAHGPGGAAEHGDTEAVDICTRALAGDAESREAVAEMWRDAWAAEGDSMPY